MPLANNIKQMTELDNAILLLLKFAKKRGIPYLTQAQVQKAMYMLQYNSRKYVGEDFYDVKFVRQSRGPISIQVKDSLGKLSREGLIDYKPVEVSDTTTAHRHSLKQEDFENVIDSNKALFALSTFQILEKNNPKFMNRGTITLGSYQTEPMLRILDIEEKTHKTLKNAPIDFDDVPLSDSIVDIISSE